MRACGDLQDSAHRRSGLPLRRGGFPARKEGYAFSFEQLGVVAYTEKEMMGQFEQEVQAGQRFQFGANWARFLESLNEDRIGVAQESLCAMLGVRDLAGKRFLDIGSGSGLFSLAARRLGATVHSLDYDPQSVGCTAELRRRFFPDDPQWRVEQGSALDGDYIRGLGMFDIVYSWGVLHHTGEMWKALTHASCPVRDNGQLFIAIYNDQGPVSRNWTAVKRLYCQSPGPAKTVIAAGVLVTQWWKTLVKDTLRGNPFRTWVSYGKERGMTPWRDVVDWAGGYPFEVASPDQIFNFYRDRGFILQQLRTDRGSGCNEFVFIRGRVAAPEETRREETTAGVRR
jgi:2-polyprenyl-3-methyl-5-hydroxy-6-metoxy-1,4-benzoquinol methylase